MLIERDLQSTDLGQLALIDRKELIEQFYRVRAGRQLLARPDPGLYEL